MYVDDSTVFKWVPYYYGDERDNRDFAYGDETEGEKQFARVVGYNSSTKQWRIEYEADGETEECTLDEILENLYSKGDPIEAVPSVPPSLSRP